MTIIPHNVGLRWVESSIAVGVQPVKTSRGRFVSLPKGHMRITGWPLRADSMQLLDEVRNAWGWAGIEPVDLVDETDFGNLIVKDVRGRYWRLCPEDLYCEVVANNPEELDCLAQNQEFLHDWYMRGLVDQAFQRLGALAPGRKYCLKIPGVLGGEYSGNNLGTILFDELIRASGHIAQLIAGLPDGALIEFSFAD